MTVRKFATVIIEANHLLREGLALFVSRSYFDVIAKCNSVEDFFAHSHSFTSVELLILSHTNSELQISRIRSAYPESKIVLLGDLALPTGRPLTSLPFDGCITSIVSSEVLVKTLDLIMLHGQRVMVLPSQTIAKNRRDFVPDVQTLMTLSVNSRESRDSKDVSPRRYGPIAANLDRPTFSERESQILDGVAKGHSNKSIAKTLSITEATVKAHLKSVLRKIRAGNRTQAAVWAIENSFSVSDIEAHLSETDSTE